MSGREGAGAGSVERDARLLKVLLGSENALEAKASHQKNQITFERHPFARDLARRALPELEGAR